MTDRFTELCSVAGPVSRETFEKVEAFAKLFSKWAAKINLVSTNEREDIWKRHILDSSQLNRLAPMEASWVDIGSGGGFPGIVMGILRSEHGLATTLVESTSRKAAFLTAAAAELAIPVSVIGKRVEDVAESLPANIVSARAMASMKQLLAWCTPWLDRGAVAFFYKGREFKRELVEVDSLEPYRLIEHRSAIDRDSVVLEVRRLA